ncbi:hypothetical protein IG631_22064 [Alternaria alternata]|nr:hypothetical protein IG631_22064 [Alternaria alternata]
MQPVPVTMHPSAGVFSYRPVSKSALHKSSHPCKRHAQFASRLERSFHWTLQQLILPRRAELGIPPYTQSHSIPLACVTLDTSSPPPSNTYESTSNMSLMDYDNSESVLNQYTLPFVISAG